MTNQYIKVEGMKTPFIPVKFTHPMSLDEFAIYLELSILWHKDIRDSSNRYEDKRWKDCQIDVLQDLLDDIDGKVKPTFEEELFKMHALLVQEWSK